MANAVSGPGALARHPVVTVGLCFLVAVAEGFDIQAIGVAAPQLAPQFGLAAGQLGWIFAISNIGLVIGAAIGGRLADSVGRRPVLTGAALTFGAFTLLTIFVSSFDALFAVRFFTGLGFGAALPNMMALATEISQPRKRVVTTAAMFCGLPVGGGTSALLTQLAPDLDWRALFVVGGVFPLLLAPALYWLLPETLRKDDAPATARTSVLKALFGEKRARATLLIWLTFLPTLVILYLLLNWLPTLVVAKGISRALASQTALAFNFSGIPGALVCSWLVDRFDARWPLTIAYVGLMGVLFALSGAEGLAALVILSAAAGFFLIAAYFALYGIAARYYPAAIRGTGSGASVAVGRLGSVIGPLLAGAWLSSGTTASGVVADLIPIAAMAAIAAFALSFCPRAPDSSERMTREPVFEAGGPPASAAR